ncbi:hypothetical protein TREMEDRAFT_58578 [Tremella mesenterica DSM 1558]|uniref:uncharacterized protein n=1 Tax=Tremella mesenterica (strain ATCC 24925 / CBS 8224 / DSM 1558 / NBRC 9311 / NRRL Y-6157 / RJB 2259-6 / UBC 559-6) TaxID=578456 RepID=UPI0003F4A34A|nr:uncharacterized protein TREMEDRAFT_58578 [Tremella mesenterica DSM 1558]EIW72415.1 hypothetical protein TREMEDRAFT_58578 [Tremella mesenterica DSM 1558]
MTKHKSLQDTPMVSLDDAIRQETPAKKLASESPVAHPASVSVQYQLAGGVRSCTKPLTRGEDLDSLVVKIARALQIPLYGTSIRLAHVRKDGTEGDIYDEYDFQAFRERALASSQPLIVKVYSASSSVRPMEPFTPDPVRSVASSAAKGSSLSDSIFKVPTMKKKPEHKAMLANDDHTPRATPKSALSTPSIQEIKTSDAVALRTPGSGSGTVSRKRRRKRKSQAVHEPTSLDIPHVRHVSPARTNATPLPPGARERTVAVSPALPREQSLIPSSPDLRGVTDEPSDDLEQPSTSDPISPVQVDDTSPIAATPDRVSSSATPDIERPVHEPASEALPEPTLEPALKSAPVMPILAPVAMPPPETVEHPSSRASTPLLSSDLSSDISDAETPSTIARDGSSAPSGRSHVDEKVEESSKPVTTSEEISAAVTETPAGVRLSESHPHPLSLSLFSPYSIFFRDQQLLSIRHPRMSSSSIDPPVKRLLKRNEEQMLSSDEDENKEVPRKKRRNRTKRKASAEPSGSDPVIEEPGPSEFPSEKVVGTDVRVSDPPQTLPSKAKQKAGQKLSTTSPKEALAGGKSTEDAPADLASKKRSRKPKAALTVDADKANTLQAPTTNTPLTSAISPIEQFPSPPTAELNNVSASSTKSGQSKLGKPALPANVGPRSVKAAHARMAYRAACVICGEIPIHLQKDCPIVKQGVDALRGILIQRKTEPDVEGGVKSASIDAIEMWIRRLTKIKSKVTGTVTPTAMASVLDSSVAEVLQKRQERSGSGSMAAVSAQLGPEEPVEIVDANSNRPETTPPSPLVNEPKRSPSPQRAILSPILHKAQALARKAGSMSGWSVSDAVIETGASESDSETSDLGGTSDADEDPVRQVSGPEGINGPLKEGESEEEDADGDEDQSDSASEDEDEDSGDEQSISQQDNVKDVDTSSGTSISVPSGDVLRHFLTKPQSPRAQRRASQLAANMRSSVNILDEDGELDEDEDESDDVDSQKKPPQSGEHKRGDEDSSIEEFGEAEDGASTNDSEIEPVTQPPQIAITAVDDEVDPSEASSDGDGESSERKNTTEVVETVAEDGEFDDDEDENENSDVPGVDDGVEDGEFDEDGSEEDVLQDEPSIRSIKSFAELNQPSPSVENFGGHIALMNAIDEEATADTVLPPASAGGNDVIVESQNEPSAELRPTQLVPTGLPSPPSSDHDQDPPRVPPPKPPPRAQRSRTSKEVVNTSQSSLAPPAEISTQRRQTRSTSKEVSTQRVTRSMSREPSLPVSPRTLRTPKRVITDTVVVDKTTGGMTSDVSDTVGRRRTNRKSTQPEPKSSSHPPESPITLVPPSSLPHPMNVPNTLSDPVDIPTSSSLNSDTPKSRPVKGRAKKNDGLFMTQSQPAATQMFSGSLPNTQVQKSQSQSPDVSSGRSVLNRRSKTSIRHTSPIVEEDEEDSLPSQSVKTPIATLSQSKPPTSSSDPLSNKKINVKLDGIVNGIKSHIDGPDTSSESESPIPILPPRRTNRSAASQPIISIPSLSSLSKEHLRIRSTRNTNQSVSQPIPKKAEMEESSSEEESSSDEESIVKENLKGRFANGSMKKRKVNQRVVKGW